MIDKMYRKMLIMSKYKFSAAKMYSSTPMDTLCLPPTMSYTSYIKYAEKRTTPMQAMTKWYTRPDLSPRKKMAPMMVSTSSAIRAERSTPPNMVKSYLVCRAKIVSPRTTNAVMPNAAKTASTSE